MHNKSVANASGVSKCLVFVEVTFLKIKPLRYFTSEASGVIIHYLILIAHNAITYIC